MPRNDGIDRTLARNRDLSASEVGRAQAHNEREKETYSNPDIVPEQTFRNVHFKQPTGSYTEMFDQLKKDGVISTRGLKEDAVTYCELLFDVNSAYFYNHGAMNLPSNSMPMPIKPPCRSLVVSNISYPQPCTPMNETGLCLKPWEKMCTTTISM